MNKFFMMAILAAPLLLAAQGVNAQSVNLAHPPLGFPEDAALKAQSQDGIAPNPIPYSQSTGKYIQPNFDKYYGQPGACLGSNNHNPPVLP